MQNSFFCSQVFNTCTKISMAWAMVMVKKAAMQW